MRDKFKKHGMRFFIILALCLGAGTSIAQPPEGAKKKNLRKTREIPLFFTASHSS